MAKAKKKKVPFEEAMELLLEKYGYIDFAVIVRSVDGVTRAFWTAGDGENPAGDRERGMVLYGEMGLLQDSISECFRPKVTVAGAPPIVFPNSPEMSP